MAPHQQNLDMGSDTESIIKDCRLHFQLTSPHTPWGELTFRSYRSTNITKRMKREMILVVITFLLHKCVGTGLEEKR